MTTFYDKRLTAICCIQTIAHIKITVNRIFGGGCVSRFWQVPPGGTHFLAHRSAPRAWLAPRHLACLQFGGASLARLPRTQPPNSCHAPIEVSDTRNLARERRRPTHPADHYVPFNDHVQRLFRFQSEPCGKRSNWLIPPSYAIIHLSVQVHTQPTTTIRSGPHGTITMSPIRIGLADDHALVMEGLRSLIDPRVGSVGETRPRPAQCRSRRRAHGKLIVSSVRFMFFLSFVDSLLVD